MKTRFAVAVIIGSVCAGSFLARAVLPPHTESLANFDKRSPSTVSTTALPAFSSSVTGQAEQTLRAMVPDVRISRDNILGTPSRIAGTRGFLTGPNGIGGGISTAALSAISTNDPHRIIKAFLNEHSAVFGHDAQALTAATVQRDYVTEHNGMRTTVWEQQVDGIAVYESLFVGHLTRNGELINISSRFVPNPIQAASVGVPNRSALVANPTIAPAQAITRAAANINVSLAENAVSLNGSAEGSNKKQTANVESLLGSTAVQLVWLPMNPESMRLCWQVILGSVEPMGHFLILVDAETGEVLLRRSLTAHIGPATYNVFTSDSPSPLSPGPDNPSPDQPPVVEREMITLSALDEGASPDGWIPDGQRTTSGNNAWVFLDRDFSETPDGPLPQGAGEDRIFDFPLNLEQAPLSYANASIVQFFYQANWFHDRAYQLGFTEAAGNFQVNNFGRGGFGNDNVIGLVQAGANLGFADNAFFSTPPDGFNGLCAMFVFTGPNPDRDGSMDQEVIVHELTHGLSNRLLGGGPGISALQSRGMGEGWSDFYALCLLSEPTDDVNGVYAAGGYASHRLAGLEFTDNYYFGIRRYPYTTDMTKNPLTFKDIDPTRASAHAEIPISPLFGGSDPSEVHNQGEVWCVTLREVWANLVTRLGWEAGNELALQLVTDGLKLAPANANYLEARDAILQADLVNSGGDNYFEIWSGFAKRGMGHSAVCPSSDTTVGVIEAFDLPPDIGTPDGILEVRVTPPSFEVMFAGETNVILVRVTDSLPVTNATITATVTGGGELTFRNDGVDPDQAANNSVYSASLVVPTNLSSITVTFVISAPEKDTAIEVVTYLIVPLPLNDNFANATKVPVAGTNYITNNKRATLQADEPVHANIFSRAGSLWWDYTPAANTNVLVDTGGSLVRTVVAVYTNNTLAALGAVGSSAGTLNRPGAFVNFNARAGVTYHIAVASYSSNNLGTLNVLIAPGVQADTNPPLVTITSPLNGQVVTSNRLAVVGLATDPALNGSGIRDVTLRVVPTSLIQPASAPPASSLMGPMSTNWNSIVGLQPGLNRIEATATDFAGNRSPATSVLVIYRPIDPPNDFFVNAINLAGETGTNTVNTIDATKQAGEPNHASVLGGKSVWWKFTAPGDGLLTIDTMGSTFDTVMGLYSGTNVAQLVVLASNDDAFEGVPGGYSRIAHVVRSNQTYRIGIDGYDGQSGTVFLSHVFTASPVYRVTAASSAGGVVSPSSVDVLSNSPVVLNAIANSAYEFDMWTGAFVSLNNPLSFVVTGDTDLTAVFRLVPVTDGFESGDFLAVPWVFGGNKPWVVQSSSVSVGQFAARSGSITHNQSSSLILTRSFRSGNASFDRQVSSELNFDVLRFYVDGALKQQWSGNTGWGPYSFSIAEGTHTLEWRYSKDPSGSSGLDAAFIDNLKLPIVVPTNSASPATLAINRQNDGSFFIDLTGQVNQQYVLQVSTNLFDWESISTNIATDGVLHIPDSPGATNGVRFYRAVVRP
jgi:hypothetical protein